MLGLYFIDSPCITRALHHILSISGLGQFLTSYRYNNTLNLESCGAQLFPSFCHHSASKLSTRQTTTMASSSPSQRTRGGVTGATERGSDRRGKPGSMLVPSRQGDCSPLSPSLPPPPSPPSSSLLVLWVRGGCVEGAWRPL